MLRPSVFLSYALVLLGLCSGCGYHFGPGNSEPSTIVIGMFANQTHEPLLEKDLTDLVISEVARGPVYTPVESLRDSLLSLEGVVNSYVSSAVAYDANDTIVRYLVEVSATVTLREEPSGKVLWKGKASAAQEYSADSDKALQRQLEEQARDVALARLAEEISQRLAQRF